MRGYVWDMILLIGIILFQTTMLNPTGIKMDFTLWMVIRTAYYKNMFSGVLFVLLAGWLMDVFSGGGLGMFMFIYVCFFLIIQRLNQHFNLSTISAQCFFGFILGILESILIGIIIFIFDNTIYPTIIHPLAFLIQLTIFSFMVPFFLRKLPYEQESNPHMVHR